MKTMIEVIRCDMCHEVIPRGLLHFSVMTTTKTRDLCPTCHDGIVSSLRFLNIPFSETGEALFVQIQVLE